MGSTFATIFPHGFTSLFIVKGERFSEWFLGISPFLVTVPLPLTRSIFHCDSDGNQTIIWLRPKQRQTSKKIYSFTYFFQLLGSNIRFLKIQKSTLTIDLFSEFSCKSRFVKVGFAITTYLSKPNITFCFWDRATEFFGS